MVVTTLNKVTVGGIPLSFDNETRLLTLGPDKLTVDEYRELERHIDVMITGRLGIRKRERHGIPHISEFVGHNLSFINKSERGRMKKAPFWLRLFFDAVVTKEELPREFTN